MDNSKREHFTKIYLAGAKIKYMKFLIQECGAKRFLTAYPIMNDKWVEDYLELKSQHPDLDLFVDSGAYSVMMQGAAIDIQDYIKFLKQWGHAFDVYACLDEIGSAEGTWENQLRMEDAGLNPLCCFHQGEDFKHLERIRDKHKYFAVGGVASGGTTNEALVPWFKDIFDLCPESQIHGFGLFAPDRLQFPWASVDSTFWLNSFRYGMVLLPDGRMGRAHKFGLDQSKVWDLTVTTVKSIIALENRPVEHESPLETPFLEGFERKI